MGGMIRGSGDLLRVASTKQMELDIEKRDEDPALAWFTFLFEEYESSCWWFAVAELVNRLYLTGLISFFGVPREPTTTTQTSLGLLGAILYYIVLSSFDPFVERSDDILAKVAAAQVILTFYFATMLQAQENSKDDDSGDPRGVWSNKIFAVACVMVGASTLVLAVVMVFISIREVRNAANKAANKAARLRERSSQEDRDEGG